MGTKTGIEWTDHTFNPWIGCTKVSEGCRHCYAEALVRRYGWAEWGPGGERKRTSSANWKKPLAWNRHSAKAGKRERVFCASLADVFDEQAPDGALDDLWGLIRETPCLDWQLLTKRPGRILENLPADWNTASLFCRGYPNVWLGVTAEDQAAYDERWALLCGVPARIRFVSYEPAVGSLDLLATPARRADSLPDWVIWGGESGPGARTMTPAWARRITRQCSDLGIAVFGKQWGAYRSNPEVFENGRTARDAEILDPKINGKGGALLNAHGRAELFRQFPGQR